MYHLSMKNWRHYVHMPSGHNAALRMSHMVHDERFWVIAALAILLGSIVTLAVWGILSEEPTTDFRPLMPYGY